MPKSNFPFADSRSLFRISNLNVIVDALINFSNLSGYESRFSSDKNFGSVKIFKLSDENQLYFKTFDNFYYSTVEFSGESETATAPYRARETTNGTT